MTISCPNAMRGRIPWNNISKKKPPVYCYLEIANKDFSTTMYAWTDTKMKDWYCGGYGGFGCLMWKVSHWRKLKRLENVISKEIMQRMTRIIKKPKKR